MDVTAMGKALSMSYDKALSGIAGMKGAEALAAEYMATGDDLEKHVDMLIRNQVIKCGASGFLTSLGGAITLPVALPANVLSVLYMQLQMIAAIAHMGGYDLQSDRVRTLGTTLTAKAIQRLSAVLFNRINRTVTMRLLSRFGTKSAINLGKAIPLVGGLIGGGFDAYSTQIIGDKAKEMFILEARHMENGEVAVEVIDVSHDDAD